MTGDTEHDGSSWGTTEQDLKGIQDALMARPNVSIRFRVGVLFAVLFALMCVMTISAIVLLSRIERGQVFFESVYSYLFEIEQARRYEKNFFLYGTNLGDAIENVDLARQHLASDAEDVRAVVGEQRFQRMFDVLERYASGLDQLLDLDESETARREELEASLRRDGAQLLVDSQDMIDRERIAMRAVLQASTVAAVAFLFVMMVIMVFFAAFMSQAVLRPLGRFMRYTDRIGSGDLSPIKPARKYRDEFTNLGIAFNRMLLELVRRQVQLVQSEKMAVVGNLTSGIAHELNNPLNNIGLSVEALLENFDDYTRDEQRRILEQTATQVERASGTVRNLLDFTRKEEPAFTSVAVDKVIGTTLRLVENEMNLAGVESDVELAEGLPVVAGNPRGLEQVFLNLFLNSLQAMPDGGKLRVVAALEDESVRIDVSDTGAGIALEDLEHIFEPFFTTKDPGKGTGLGLPVTQSIVREHGGRILVTSEVGQGSTFSVYLPVPAGAREKGIRRP